MKFFKIGGLTLSAFSVLAVIMTGPIPGDGIKVTLKNGSARCLFVNVCDRTTYGTVDCYTEMADGETLTASFPVAQIAKMERVGHGVDCPAPRPPAMSSELSPAPAPVYDCGKGYVRPRPNEPCQQVDAW